MLKIEIKYQIQLEKIRAEYATELAALNSTLHETRDFKSIRFRSVFDRKITALCETFGKLANLEKCLREYVSRFGGLRGPERDAARIEFANALGDFEGFFVPVRIFFSKQLAEQITQAKLGMNLMAVNFMAATGEDMLLSHSGAVWNEANDYVDKELPKIRREIEEEIRKELGEVAN